MKPSFLAALLAAFLCVGWTEQTPAKVDVVIHAGRLIDGIGTSPRENASVLISGDRIAAVQDGWQTPAGARVIDLRIVDRHAGPHRLPHPHHRRGHRQRDRARRHRDAARRRGAVDGLREAHARGRVHDDPQRRRRRRRGRRAEARDRRRRSCRARASGRRGRRSASRAGTATRAACGPISGSRPTWMDGIVDSADEARKAVRYQHKYGADLIKITATGGVLSIGDSGDAQQFTDDEMRAIVEAGAPARHEGRRARPWQAGHRRGDSRRRRFDRARHLRRRRELRAVQGARHAIWCRRSWPARRSPSWRTIPGHFHPTVQAKAATHRPAHSGHVQARLCRRRESRVRHRLRRVEPRRERAGVRLHGGGRHACRSKRSSRPRATPPISLALRIASDHFRPGRFADIIAVAAIR